MVLRKNEVASLRTEKVIMRAIWGVELMDKRSSQELIDLLGLEK